MKILIATSHTDFDPTEVAVPWKALRDAGHEVVFATENGMAGSADQRMLDGNMLGILKPFLIAQAPAQVTYREMLMDANFQSPLIYEDIDPHNFDGLILPGGHAKGTIPYLESGTLQTAITAFFQAQKPVGAICHGVVAAARSIDPETGKSVLYGRKTTALLERQEMLAYHLTKNRLGEYYRTYPQSVEAEVTAALKSPQDFQQGPLPILRDNPKHLSRGFTLRDGNYLSARWPGDVYRFSWDYLQMLSEQ